MTKKQWQSQVEEARRRLFSKPDPERLALLLAEKGFVILYCNRKVVTEHDREGSKIDCDAG